MSPPPKKVIANIFLGIIVLIIWVLAGKRFIDSSKDVYQTEVDEQPSVTKFPTKAFNPTRADFRYKATIRDPFEPYISKPPKIPKQKPQKNPLSGIKLLGVLVDSSNSIAFIYDGGKNVYLELGDSVRGYRLEQIYSDSIVLNLNNKATSIKLPSLKLNP